MHLFDSINHTKSLGRWSDLAMLALRLYTGITMASAGFDKIPLPEWMVDQVVQMGFPFPTFFGWLACFSEFGFGLLLAMGLWTRVSAFFVGFTMAVASFVFQGVLPIIDMHIAQHYVWSCLLFMALGGGKWSLDYWLNQKATEGQSWPKWLRIAGFLAVLSGALFLEFTGTPNPGDQEAEQEITSVNIPGTFNNWDPSANEMTTEDGLNYYLQQKLEEGLIQFKFTANKSWDINFGDEDREGQGLPISGTLDEGADNIKVYIPESATYEFQVNKNDFSFKLSKVEG